MPDIIVSHPREMCWRAVTSDSIGLLYQAAALSTSTEHPGSDPMLDEWIMLARALVDVITLM